MPKLSSATPSWVVNLRTLIKRQHGTGWQIYEQSGRVKLTRRWPDGGSSSVMLDLPWNSSATTAVLRQLEDIRGRMEQAGLSLSEAARLQAAAQASVAAADTFSANGESVDWRAVVDRFAAHKTAHSGAVKDRTWTRMYLPVMKQVLAALASRPLPRNGRDLLARLRDTYGGEPGSQGRRQRILYAAQLLRFAVEECGAPERWRPPARGDLGALVGRKTQPDPDSTPITDQQLLRLLEGIPDARWKLAIGLMACFGLRPVELRHCRPSADGRQLVVSYSKRTSRGSTRPRDVSGIDPIGWPGLSDQLLGQLQMAGRVPGAVSLPPLGPEDTGTASAVSTYLRRRPVWEALRAEAAAAGERLTVYSLRHGFALRAHEVAELSPRVTAALMGHSLQTHNTHYGRWTNGDTVATAMSRARQRVEQRQQEHQRNVA